MQKCLADAGPIIALFDRDDSYHKRVKDFLSTYRGQLITTWPVITEVMYMLSFSTLAQLDFLRWIERGGLQVMEIPTDSVTRLIALTEKYADVPIDLADASLIVISETCAVRDIISIDSDFYVYRDIRKRHLNNVLL